MEWVYAIDRRQDTRLEIMSSVFAPSVAIIPSPFDFVFVWFGLVWFFTSVSVFFGSHRLGKRPVHHPNLLRRLLVRTSNSHYLPFPPRVSSCGAPSPSAFSLRSVPPNYIINNYSTEYYGRKRTYHTLVLVLLFLSDGRTPRSDFVRGR